MTRRRRCKKDIFVFAFFGVCLIIFVLLILRQFQQLSSISSSLSSVKIVHHEPIISKEEEKENEEEDLFMSSWRIPKNPIKETAWISNALHSIIKPQPSTSENNNNISKAQQDNIVSSIIGNNNNCPITRQVKIISSSSNNKKKSYNKTKNNTNTENNDSRYYWLLQTYDEYGKPKKQGGDEFYITYTDHRAADAINTDIEDHQEHDNHPHAIAEITDLLNGLYKLEFISNPLYHRKHRLVVVGRHGYGGGTLTVVFQYICGIGQLNPPIKSYWTTGGATIAKFSVNISTFPPITPFPYFGYDESVTNDNQQHQQRVYIEDIFDDHCNNNIVAVGDSMMKQFVKPLQLKIPNISIPLNTTTLPIWKSTIQQRILEQQQQQQHDGNNNNKTNNIVLLLSSHAWDLLETQKSGNDFFIDHEQALRELLSYIISNYPKLKIYWKSPTALHIHVPYLDIKRQQQMIKNKIGFLTRIKYMSKSRSYKLYKLQRRLIVEESEEFANKQVTFLDVYKASIGADATKQGDGRHYNEKWNIMSINWFLRYSIVDEIWKKNMIHYMSSTAIVEPSTTTTSLNILHVEDKEEGEQQQQQLQQRFLVMDCTTTSSSWVNIVNGILMATITNRTIVWKNNSNSDNNDNSCMTESSSSSSFLHLLDSQWKMTINDSSVELLRKRKQVKEFSILSSRRQKKILSLEEIRKLANLNSEHDIQYTNILYSEGEDYLFGMILYNILRHPPSLSLSSPQSLLQLLPKQQGSLFENQTKTTQTKTNTATTSGWEENHHFLLPSESIVIALDNADLLQRLLSSARSSCIDKILQSIINLYPFLPCHILILLHEKQQQADDDKNKIVTKFYSISSSSSATGKTKNCTIVPIQAESIRNIITKEEDYNDNNNSMNDSFFQDTLSYLSIIANLEVDACITSSCDDDDISSGDDDNHSNAAVTSSWKKGMLWYLQSQVARDKGVLPIDPIPFHCCQNTHQ